MTTFKKIDFVACMMITILAPGLNEAITFNMVKDYFEVWGHEWYGDFSEKYRKFCRPLILFLIDGPLLRNSY